jgi:hypothetical protein
MDTIGTLFGGTDEVSVFQTELLFAQNNQHLFSLNY